MRIGILTVQVPFIRGGAEAHAISLKEAFRHEGFEAEIITVPFNWYPPEFFANQILACKLLDVEESCGSPIDLVVGLKFPAYLVPHSNKVLWILHQHRSAYDLWRSPHGDLHQHPAGLDAARFIRGADRALFPTVKKIFSNSQVVADRLWRFCSVDSEPLYHPPPNAHLYNCAAQNDFLLMPGRVNALKRQELVLEALLLTKQDVKVIFIGQAEDQAYQAMLQKQCAKLAAGYVTWLGSVPEELKIKLFADCLGVVAPPIDEDYGYVTLEAMLSSKPVITCDDSGGPLEFIIKNETGLVCKPEPRALAGAMDYLWSNRKRARELGEAAKSHYNDIGFSWENVVSKLVS